MTRKFKYKRELEEEMDVTQQTLLKSLWGKYFEVQPGWSSGVGFPSVNQANREEHGGRFQWSATNIWYTATTNQRTS